MRDIKNLSIWKQEPVKKVANDYFYGMDIVELNLSVRSYNCLKRAGCHTIGDILPFLEEEEQGQGGLRRIRNLGSRSEQEIKEKIKEIEECFASDLSTGGYPYPGNGYSGKCNGGTGNGAVARRLVRPARNTMQMRVEQFPLSRQSLERLKSCGVRQVSDIYRTDPKKDPGWFVIRELFEKILEA